MSESTLRTRKQPSLAGDMAIDAALWRLSVVLREISDNLERDHKKEQPPSQALAGDALTGGGKEGSTNE